jgi:ankyrin repeat protein
VLDLIRRHGWEIELGAADLFLAACARGDSEAASALLAESPGLVSSLSEQDRRMLPTLAGNGNTEAVRLLLDAGIGIETRGDYDATPLICAAWGGHVDTARLLLERGASLEARQAFGGNAFWSALYASVHFRQDADWPAMVQLLIDAGSDISRVRLPAGSPAVDALLRRLGVPERDSPSDAP